MSSFSDLKTAGEAKSDGLLAPADCVAAITADPNTLVVDMRANAATWVKGAYKCDLGMLAIKADASLGAMSVS